MDSPGQKTHESAASRIYCELIKLAFVLRPHGGGGVVCRHKHGRGRLAVMWESRQPPNGVKEHGAREREREAGEKSSGKQQTISADVNKST